MWHLKIFANFFVNCLKCLFYIVEPTEDGRYLTTLQSLQRNHVQNYHIFFKYIKMCCKLCLFIWGIWWFHRSKDFEAIKSGKLAIRPWLSCPYTLMDLLSSVAEPNNGDIELNIGYDKNYNKGVEEILSRNPSVIKASFEMKRWWRIYFRGKLFSHPLK